MEESGADGWRGGPYETAWLAHQWGLQLFLAAW